MSLWVVGGQQRAAFDRQRAWEGFELAVVVRISDKGKVERVLEYHSPRHVTADDKPMHLFTASTIVDRTMFLCTPTEVLICDFPDLAVRRVISHPFFNDLHHVTVGPQNTLFVAVTGLDAVAELTLEGEVLRLVSTLEGTDVWDRFSPDVDYRKWSSTKPHASHPNFVFFVDGKPCVTRFEQRDAVFLDTLQPVAEMEAGPHDGFVIDGRVYFTTVDGHVVQVDPETGVKQSLNLNALADSEFPLGWCRGLLVEGAQAWVGFSRLRFSRLRKNLSWIRRGFKGSYVHHHPTRVVQVDMNTASIVSEVNLEASGINAVFSILRA